MIKLPNYKILKQLGSGGMSDVYLAEHTLMKRKVAIKIMHPHLTSNKDFIKRFKKEAESLALLDHPNIVRVNEFFEYEGELFLVMEYVEGMQLDEYIKKVSGPIAEEKLIPLFQQVVSAIGYAHKKNLIHRDIKPSNIIINNNGMIKVLDFGIAKLLTEDHAMTKTGVPVGTVMYMSPEQCKGEKIDFLSDIYSLGVTLFQMACGQIPYRPTGNSVSIGIKIINTPFPNAKDLYPPLSGKILAIINKCTQKNKEDRYLSCDALNKDLSRKIARTTGDPFPKEVHVTPSLQKYKTVLLSCMLLIVLGLGAFLILNDGEGETPAEVTLKIKGCMDSDADNYNPEATFEDGSCQGVTRITDTEIKYTIKEGEAFLPALEKMKEAVNGEGYSYENIKVKHIKYIIKSSGNILKFNEAKKRFLTNNETIYSGDYFYVDLSQIPEKKECKSDISDWKRQGYKTGKIKWAKAIATERCGVTYYLYTAEDRALEVKRKQEEKNIKKLVTDHKAIKFTSGSGLKGKKVCFYVNRGQHQNKDHFGITKTHFKNEERARLNPKWGKYIVLDAAKACDGKDHECETHDCKEGCPKFVPKKLDIRVNPIHEKKGHECNESCSEFVPKEIDVSKYTPEKGWLKKKIVWAPAGDKKVVGDVTYYKYSKIDIALNKKYNSELNAIRKFKNNRDGVKGSNFSSGWDKVWFFCQSHDNKTKYGVSVNNFTSPECKKIGEEFMQKWSVKVKVKKKD